VPTTASWCRGDGHGDCDDSSRRGRGGRRRAEDPRPCPDHHRHARSPRGGVAGRCDGPFPPVALPATPADGPADHCRAHHHYGAHHHDGRPHDGRPHDGLDDRDVWHGRRDRDPSQPRPLGERTARRSHIGPRRKPRTIVGRVARPRSDRGGRRRRPAAPRPCRPTSQAPARPSGRGARRPRRGWADRRSGFALHFRSAARSRGSYSVNSLRLCASAPHICDELLGAPGRQARMRAPSGS
jgi:hypothetical protein